MAILNGVHISSLRASLDGCERNDNGILSNGQHQANVDELVRPKGEITIVEFALETDRPGGGIDLIVDRHQLARRKFGLIVTAVRIDPQSLILHVLDHFLEAVFGECKQGSYGLHLRDDDKSVGIRRANHVALIDEPQSYAAGQRRFNLAVGQLQFLIVNLRLIGAYSSLQLSYGRILRIHLLLRDDTFFVQLVIAPVVDSGVVELGLVAGQLSLHLLQRHLEGPGIDFREEIAFPHKLAFVEMDLLELPIDSALHGDGVERRHRPQPRKVIRHILFKGRHNCD